MTMHRDDSEQSYSQSHFMSLYYYHERRVFFGFYDGYRYHRILYNSNFL